MVDPVFIGVAVLTVSFSTIPYLSTGALWKQNYISNFREKQE
ncbi:MAG TPA: hypothetical protein VFD60_10855 [Nitrososphaeraceae archaeon]|nr:hypothetical protein [Nitrososphaeraceae archaeon]